MLKKAGETMSKSNFIVRGGADFSKIKQEMQKTQKELNLFQNTVNGSMKAIGTAFKIGLGYISVRALASFTKEITKWGSDVAEVQNVVSVTFGTMTEDIEEFSKSAMDNFGLSELAAKKYSSTMGAMLKSSGLVGEEMRDMSIGLSKLTADMASFHNLDNDAVFKKIMSGMTGMSRPLKDLGINMNIANLEAYAMSQGIKKTYQQMSQAEQMLLRYNYLLSVTGDIQGDFSRNAHNWAHQLKILKEQWNMLKATLGQAFINALMPVIRGFNILIKYIQIAAEHFKAFTILVFGETQASRGTAKNLGYTADALEDIEDGFDGAGKAGKKAGKDLKGAVAGFDEINTLADQTKGGLGDIVDELDDVGGVDFGSTADGELDVDTSKLENKFSRLKDTINDFYNKWGAKDIFDGIKKGAALVNFDNIKTNFESAFSNLKEIAGGYFENLQPVFQAAGETFGTLLKYGIASIGNLFEPITEGFANSTENLKEPLQEWIEETSGKITNGYNNLTTVFETLGESWLESIEKYKQIIATETENTFLNISNTLTLIGTIITETWEIITGKIAEFVIENTKGIEGFMKGILQIFTDLWGLINKVWEDVLDDLKEFWDEWGVDIVKSVMDVVNQIGGWFLYLWNDLVMPVWNVMMEWLKEIWDEGLKDIVSELLGFVGRVGELILLLWNTIIKPLLDKVLNVLVPGFKESFGFILEVVSLTVIGIGKLIENLLKILNGIIDFVVGVFTGDWKRAWQGVSNVFKGIVDGLVSIFKIPLNHIISMINKFIRGLNKIEIPDWVPGVGGKGFNIREIPALASGGITNGPILAMVGDNPGGKEVISPLDKLQDMLISAVGTALIQSEQFKGTNKEPIITKVYLNNKEIAMAIYDPLKAERDRRGDPIAQPI